MRSKSSQITLGGVLRAAAIVGLVVFVLVYVKFQARNIIEGPTISLYNAPETLQSNKKIILEGNAKNIVKLTLNGREITTDQDGNFTQTVYLEKGYTILTLYAEDRFGRTMTIEQDYVYVGESE